MTSAKKTQLRRTIRPYAGQIIVLSIVTLGALFVSVSRGVWGLVLSMPVAWLLFGVLVFVGLRYRISWDQETVCQQASGGPDVCIKYDEITEIAREKAKINEMVAMSSPYRRIAIYGGLGEDIRHINVSLRHFRDEDVQQLMAFIHKRRPDLVLPKGIA